MAASDVENRILVLAPVGHDAECIDSVLMAQSLAVKICADHAELCDEIGAGAGCVLVVEEAIRGGNLRTFIACLQRQPPWSDIPVIVLTSGGSTSESQLAALTKMMLIGNVTLLERPLRAITLLTGVQGALRGRFKQYVVRDLLEDQVRAREKESAARQEAERLNRVKDEFLSTLSHELRTPLTPLLGWTQVLLREQVDETMRVSALRTIERNVKIQIQLIDDLLDISRIINGKMRLEFKRVDANKVLEAAVEVVRPAALAKGIKLDVQPSAVPLSVLGDFDRLQQVFWNLLSNAVKFTGAGGTVTARVRRSGSTIQCVFSDTGVGIKKEFLPRLFERFSQADSSITRRYGGLGIGLSLVHSLLALHGGTIKAESGGEGKGATFTVSLPIYSEHYENEKWSEPAQANKENGYRNSKRLDGLKVLLVEDNREARELLCAIMSQSGGAVTSAATVQEGFKKFMETKPNIIVSDLGLPGEDGYELIRRIRAAEDPDAHTTPAVALTAYATDVDRSRCLAAGFQRHLVKPIEPDRLVCALAELAECL